MAALFYFQDLYKLENNSLFLDESKVG